MGEELTITTEQVDDFPVLIVQMERTTIPELLDRHFPLHGYWQGLSLGRTGTAWLGHILSVGGHRLNHGQPWVEKNPQTVQRSLGQAITGLDFSYRKASREWTLPFHRDVRFAPLPAELGIGL